MKIAYIKWFDSTYTSEQISIANLPPLIIVETAGIYITEDEKQVVVALDYFDKQKDGRHIAQIPKVNIIRQEIFTIEEEDE